MKLQAFFMPNGLNESPLTEEQTQKTKYSDHRCHFMWLSARIQFFLIALSLGYKWEILCECKCNDHSEVSVSSRYSRSDCSGVRTTTVTLVESDWPMLSVTVSSNLYTPDVRFETIIWSLYWVSYKVWNTKIYRCKVIDCSLSWTLNKTTARSSSKPTPFTHLIDSIRVSSKHFPLEG